MAETKRPTRRTRTGSIGVLVLAAVLVPQGHGDDWLTQALRRAAPARAPEATPSTAPDATPPAKEADTNSADRDGGTNTIQVSSAGTVEMHVADVPLGTVLEILSVQSHRNIIATAEVQGTVTAHLFNVTFEDALDAVLAANHAGYREVGNFIYVYTNEELAAMHQAEHPPQTRVFPINYIAAKDALSVITPLLSESGSVTATPETKQGLGSTSEEGGGDDMAQQDFLVVRDYPRVLQLVERTLREVDARPKQVLVEATILGVTLDDENSLGVDFTIVGGVDLELLGSTSTAVTDLTVGQLPQNRFEQWNSNVATDFTGAVPHGGITVGVIKDHVGAFVRALESITDTVVLANPKVLALNKQKAQVIVGRRDGYITTTVTETQAIQSVEFLETGTQLIFRPYISNDGHVRMELHPEDSVGAVVNGLPSEQTTEVTTNVIVRDGETILIGGLFREVTTESRNQVPLLGDIPVLGTVFQGRNDHTERQEVIILLSVHVVKDDAAYARASEQAHQDIERMRVGLHQHLMWNGRERIAQSYYHKSLEDFTRGDTDKALWNVRMALYNNPHLLSAIELKEKLLGRREWDDEGSATRDFIRRAIMEEQGLRRPQYDRPAPPFSTTPEENSAPEPSPPPLHGPSGFEQTSSSVSGAQPGETS